MTDSNLTPHRGGLILAFGLVGLVSCPPFGIAAWVMGNTDLRQMAEGTMDPSGHDLTNAGKILGIVSVVLAVLGMATFLMAMLVLGGTAIFGNM